MGTSKTFREIMGGKLRGSSYVPGDEYLYFHRTDNRSINRIRIAPTRLVATGEADIPLGTQINLDKGDLTDVTLVDIMVKPHIVAVHTMKMVSIAAPISFPPADPSFLTQLSDTTEITKTRVELTTGSFPVYVVVRTTGKNRSIVKIQKPADYQVSWFTYNLQAMDVEYGGQGFYDPRDLLIAADGNFAFVSDAFVNLTDPMRPFMQGQLHRVYRKAGSIDGAAPDWMTRADSEIIAPAVASEFRNPHQIAMVGDLVMVIGSDKANSQLWMFLNQQLLGDLQGYKLTDGIGATPPGPGFTTAEAPVGLLVRPAQSGQYHRLQVFIADTGAGITKKQRLKTFVLNVDNPDKPSFETAVTLETEAGGVAKDLEDVGFLTWADPQQTSFFLLEPKKETVWLARPDLATAKLILTQVASGLGDTPRSLQVVSPDKLYVVCENKIVEVDLSVGATDGVVPIGIGFVPFDDIAQTGANQGRANTMSRVGYFFQVENLPFGDTLPLKINHKAAWGPTLMQEARYYSVRLIHVGSGKKVDIAEPFVDLKRIAGKGFVTETNTPIAGANGAAGHWLYKVRDPADTWLNPYLSAFIDTTKVDDGVHLLQVRFFAKENSISSATGLDFEYYLRIENSQLQAVLTPPSAQKKGGMSNTTKCGFLEYDETKKIVAKTFKMQYFTSYAHEGAMYSLRAYEANKPITGFIRSGAVIKGGRTEAVETMLNEVLGTCRGVVLGITLHAYRPVTNGLSAYSHSKSDTLSFALIPEGLL